jgi:hypothetical protein
MLIVYRSHVHDSHICKLNKKLYQPLAAAGCWLTTLISSGVSTIQLIAQLRCPTSVFYNCSVDVSDLPPCVYKLKHSEDDLEGLSFGL